MAQQIEIKHSSNSGSIPTTSSLHLGQLAINSWDGKAYIKKNNGVESIIELGTGGSSTTGSNAFTSSILEYYVDKRFSGGCGVTLLTGKIISSSNSNYLTQFSASKAGNPNYPYPDPWSANLAASSSISSGTISSARIIVKTGNTYTYGSSVLTQNGDMTGSLTNNLTPDIAVSQSDYNLRAFDLITPNIEYYFEPSSSLYNINKTWRQELVYYTSSDWNIAPAFKITGQGKFVGVYGQSSGFNFAWGTMYAPRAEVTLQADHIIQNMWNGWQVGGQKVNIDVNKWWSYGAIFLNTAYSFDWPSQSLVDPSASLGMPIVNVNINELRWGQNQFGGIASHANDFWAGLAFGNSFGGEVNININKVTAYTRFTDGMFRWDVTNSTTPTCYNNIININIGYFSGSRTNVGGPISKIARGTIAASSHVNCYYKIHIDKFDAWGIGLGTSEDIRNPSGCTFIFSCNDYRNYLSTNYFNNDLVRVPILMTVTSSASSSLKNNQITVTGTYRNYAEGCPIVGWLVGSGSGDDNLSYNTLFLDNFKGYQLSTGSVALTMYNYFYTYSTGSYIVIKDSLLYSSGSDIISNSTGKIPNIIFNGTVTNRDIPSTVSAEGTFNISANLNKLIY